MKRNKSILQVLLGVLLCAALVFPGMKATVFAVDRIDETDTAMTENGAIPENEGIKENDPLPGSEELLYEDAAFASTDGDALTEGSESAAAEGSYKESYEEDLLPEGEELEEDGNGTSGDGVLPEEDDPEEVENNAPADNDLPEEVENSVPADNDLPEEAENSASADNDFLQEEGNGDPSEDAYAPAEDGTSTEMTAQPEEPAQDELQETPAEDGASSEMTALPEEPAQDELQETPAEDGASSEMTVQPEEPAQDELQEAPAEEPSVEADAEELADAASYDSAAGLCPLARELTFNGKAQELIDVEDIPEGALCYSLDGEAFSPKIPTGTNAGDYIVYYRASGEETAQVSSLTVTISKADVIFTAPSAVE